jgi:uncharacterized repeat protein (TIGR03803 family)
MGWSGRLARALLPLGLAAALAACAATPSPHQPSLNDKGFSVLHAFTGGRDGDGPCGGVLVDGSGKIIGNVVRTGELLTPSPGAIFELTPGTGAYHASLPYTLDENEGEYPCTTPITDARGNLYIFTTLGGKFSEHNLALKLTPSPLGYSESARRELGPDAGMPRAIQILGQPLDAGANFYVSAWQGGPYGGGAVFMLRKSDLDARLLRAFEKTMRDTYNMLGAWPRQPLTLSPSGSLYGAAGAGRYRAGIVFELNPLRPTDPQTNTWAFGGSDGESPNGGLVRDAHGTFYGTTGGGGKYGLGVVFKLEAGPSGYRETVLHDFRGTPDGAVPGMGLVALHGALYGTTLHGGSSEHCLQQEWPYSSPDAPGCGTLFRLSALGNDYQVVHVFARTDGTNPSYLAAYGSALYGTTMHGGIDNHGVVYRFVP